ncbi:Molybdopterin-synthase adenylyltransferase [Rubripirellula lacrimiformis]|uniref:Molybdopterin-synthase adenylyltransferase n=1 Tax=Rubripirellula lacrimiformis TaxID=1930273 RepID=A0A517NK53_9BACT|nr:ThiF family adenylyltransferase [Rubripirellula lacrimiformis]QDT07500.1 Molybdopterin-synthase adenylyltransferase [Rubripirellula lacrimiformis]
MNSDVIVRLTGRQKEELRSHLFPGDESEAVALALCGKHRGAGRICLSVMEIHPIPHSECDRSADRVTWSTDRLRPLLQRANDEGLSILKIHSHPNGFDRFSEYDDRSDADFFTATESWVESGGPHATAVMLPSGCMFGRYGIEEGGFQPLQMMSVAGDELEFWFDRDEEMPVVPDFADRHAQVLGEGTFAKMRRLRVAVVGCSGTGSPVVEQLYRLGVGELVLVDPDSVGPENLNRIINSRHRHASSKTPKVKLLADAIEDTGLGTHVFPIQKDLSDPEAIQAVASCDLIFGCVDSVFARFLLNKIASTYCVPYIDVGIGIRANGSGGIGHATGAVHYLQPDGSSLINRGVFSMEDVRADAMARSAPDDYADQLDAGYIRGADVSRPAVITINQLFGSYAVLEMLARLHPIRTDDNAGFAAQRWSLSGDFRNAEPDGERCTIVAKYLGSGDMIPPLGLPALSIQREVRRANA